MSQALESLVMLPETCHDCKILAKFIHRLTKNASSGSTIPIILACAKYAEKTVLTGIFPGRAFTYMMKPRSFIDTYLKPEKQVTISGTASVKGIFGMNIICPINVDKTP